MMRAAAIGLLALALAGCVPTHAVTSYGVDARIVDAVTQKPIAGATVSLTPRIGAPATRATISDAEGIARLPRAVGRVWRPIYGDFYIFENIHVEARGYASQDIEAGVTSITIALQPVAKSGS